MKSDSKTPAPSSALSAPCSKCRQINSSVQPHGKGFYCSECWTKISATNPPKYIAEILGEMQKLGFQAHDSSWRQIRKFIKAAFEKQFEAGAESGVPLSTDQPEEQ